MFAFAVFVGVVFCSLLIIQTFRLRWYSAQLIYAQQCDEKKLGDDAEEEDEDDVADEYDTWIEEDSPEEKEMYRQVS